MLKFLVALVVVVNAFAWFRAYDFSEALVRTAITTVFYVGVYFALRLVGRFFRAERKGNLPKL